MNPPLFSQPRNYPHKCGSKADDAWEVADQILASTSIMLQSDLVLTKRGDASNYCINLIKFNAIPLSSQKC